MENKEESKDKSESSAPSGLRRWFPFLLALLGVPAAGVALQDWVKQHIPLAAGLAAIYIVLDLIVIPILLRQQPRFLDWLNLRVTWFSTRYYKQYCRHLRDALHDIDAKSAGIQGPFALGIDEVFVELNLAPIPPDQAPSNPIPLLPRELRQGRHTVWEFFTVKFFANQHLVILGAPGSGKTTLMQHIALTLLDSKKRRALRMRPRLPILLLLRDQAATITARPTVTLPEVVQGFLKLQDQEAPEGWLKNQLRRGRCLILLDGLDEVADPNARRIVVEWVEQQMRSYGRNRFVITSRPYGYRGAALNNVVVLGVQPFSREQTEEYVGKWYAATAIKSAQRDSPAVHRQAKKDAEDLLRRIKAAPALLDLAVNPLLLYMMATVHKHHAVLPGKRVELYARVCEVFLGRRREAQGIAQNLSPAQKQTVLQPLAYHLMRDKKRGITVEEAEAMLVAPLARVQPDLSVVDFLTNIQEGSGLLQERASGVYEFAHQTFQEYLAAAHIKEQRLGEELLDRVLDNWWHEAIHLYAAQSDATAIIKKCLDMQPPSAVALALAIECEEEALTVDPLVRAKVQEWRAGKVDDANREIATIQAERMLRQRLQGKMLRLDDDRAVAMSLITCAEYQLFIDAQLARGQWFQPDHWATTRFQSGQGELPMLGVRPQDADVFCDWLSQREQSPWRYRLPRQQELRLEHLSPPATAELAQGLGYWSRVTLSGDLVRWKLARTASGPTAFERASALFQEPVNALSADRTGALSYARGIAHDLAATFSRTHEFAQARGGDLAIPFESVQELVRACGLTRNLASVFDLATPRPLARDLRLALDGARNAADALHLASLPILARGASQFRASATGEIIDFAGMIEFVLDRTSAPARVRVFDAARAHNFDVLTWDEAALTLRWLIRFAALVVAEQHLWNLEHPSVVSRRKRVFYMADKKIGFDHQSLRTIVKVCLEFYVQFTILQARMTSTLQPSEGILVMKEKKKVI